MSRRPITKDRVSAQEMNGSFCNDEKAGQMLCKWAQGRKREEEQNHIGCLHGVICKEAANMP